MWSKQVWLPQANMNKSLVKCKFVLVQMFDFHLNIMLSENLYANLLA